MIIRAFLCFYIFANCLEADIFSGWRKTDKNNIISEKKPYVSYTQNTPIFNQKTNETGKNYR